MVANDHNNYYYGNNPIAKINNGSQSDVKLRNELWLPCSATVQCSLGAHDAMIHHASLWSQPLSIQLLGTANNDTKINRKKQ